MELHTTRSNCYKIEVFDIKLIQQFYFGSTACFGTACVVRFDSFRLNTCLVVSFSAASFDTPVAACRTVECPAPQTRVSSMVCVSVVVRYKNVDQNGLGL